MVSALVSEENFGDEAQASHWPPPNKTARDSAQAQVDAAERQLEVARLPVAVQVNGRTRGIIQLAPDASEAEALEAVRAVEAARQALEDTSVKRVIYVPRRIINLVTQD